MSASPPPTSPLRSVIYERVDISLEAIVDRMAGARCIIEAGKDGRTLDAASAWEEYDTDTIQKFLDLSLTGFAEVDGVGEQLEIVPDSSHSHVLEDHRAKLLYDIDSALCFSPVFPWLESYDILTTYFRGSGLNSRLHVRVPFQVCLASVTHAVASDSPRIRIMKRK